MKTRTKWVSIPCVVVCGFISQQSGKVLFDYRQQKSYTGLDMCDLFDAVVKTFPCKSKLVLHGDGASINKSKEASHAIENPLKKTTKVVATTNVPYRPDLMGVGKLNFQDSLSLFHFGHLETCWLHAKRQYRKEIARLKVLQKPIDNLAVVAKCIDALNSEDCKRWAIEGWDKLWKAKPKQLEQQLPADKYIQE